MESKSINLDQSIYEVIRTNVPLANEMSLNNSNNNNISDIEKQKSAISAETYHTIGKILEILGEKIEKMIPYPNSDEIPEVKIQDEDTFTSGEEIKFYKDFDDTKFNKCKNLVSENARSTVFKPKFFKIKFIIHIYARFVKTKKSG